MDPTLIGHLRELCTRQKDALQRAEAQLQSLRAAVQRATHCETHPPILPWRDAENATAVTADNLVSTTASSTTQLSTTFLQHDLEESIPDWAAT